MLGTLQFLGNPDLLILFVQVHALPHRAAGFAVAAAFLSTLIPKFQYWFTKKTTGVDAFPGVYEFEKEKK